MPAMCKGKGTRLTVCLILKLSLLLVSLSGSQGADIIQDNCRWDVSKPFAQNIYCLHERQKRRAMTDFEHYGHPCTSYTRLIQPERRVGNQIDELTGTALCDRTLKRRWYRFDGPGGGVMPESCVEEFNCGTHSPIWLNGNHPAMYGENLDVSVCASLTGDCCARRWYIRVANCGDFFTYLLTNTPGCFMAYCAGSQEPCPPGQSSITGFSPGCSENFPAFTGDVDLYVGEEGHLVAVYCDYSGPMPIGATIESEWYVQGENGDGEFPVFVDSMRGRRRSTLQEGHWAGKMGSTIYCKMRARWMNNTGVPSPYKESEKYFAGIKISRRVVEVDESEAAAVISVQSTMPITCLPQFADSCKLTLEMAHDPEMGGKHCVDGKMEQIVFGDCNIEITPSNWRDVHNVTVKAVRDFYNDGTKNMRVSFKPVYSTVNSGLWNDYQLPEVEVVAKDVKNGLCSSTGDPHYNTFDGFYYHVYLEGEFVLYKNTRIPVQINTRLEECGKLVTCNCGVAVKAGDDVIVIDRCMRRKRNLAYGSSFPEGWRSLHRHALEQGDDFVDGLKIYEYENGRRYTVHLPTGAFLDFRVGEDWVNIYLHASSDDWQSTLGLCGTFDGNLNNEFLFPDQVTYSNPRQSEACGQSTEVCKFAEAWRVPKSESFFGPIVEVPVEDHEFFSDQRYCKCEKSGSGQSTVLCNYHSDVHNCQAEEIKKWGVDRTNDVLYRSSSSYSSSFSSSSSSSFRVRRDLRRSVRSDNDDVFDFFEAEFVFNETFRGKVPQWPTPSGIDESYARRYCQDIIDRSQASHVCTDLKDNKMALIVDECMTDIKVTDLLDWAASSLSTITEDCRNEIHQTAEYWEEGANGNTGSNTDDLKYNTSRGAYLLAAVCPGDCSLHGTCYQGACSCQYGYSGDDCSINIFKQPRIQHVTDDGFCDTSVRPCKAIILHGSDFRNSSDLQCHFRDGHDDTRSSFAKFITFEEISCPVPVPLTNVEDVHPALTAYSLTVTFEGFRTDETSVIVYDSQCYACDKSQHTTSACERQPRSCIIDSLCYGPSQRDPDSCCRECNPTVSTDSFSPVDANKLMILYPRQTDHVVHHGKEWKLTVRAFGGSGCPFVYGTSEPEEVILDYLPRSRDLMVRLLSAPVGAYSINITATDPCGTSLSRTYRLTVQPDPSPTATQNCTENRAPYFNDKMLSFTLTPGESLTTQISAQDDDDRELEYYVIKNTNVYVSIDNDGMFRYLATDSTRLDNLKIVALDHCKQTALTTVVIETRDCPCGNGGTCVPREGAGLYDCVCAQGYTGERCYNVIT